MEEKYITRLLTFSDENLMGNVETISLTRKNVKELLNELHQNYIPIFIIEKKKSELEKEYNKFVNEINNNEMIDKFLDWQRVNAKLELVNEILNERSNTDD